jgi:hypothetical protein
MPPQSRYRARPRVHRQAMRSPHIFTRKSRLQPGEFLVTSAKRLLQQYRHKADIPRRVLFCPLSEVKRTWPTTDICSAIRREGVSKLWRFLGGTARLPRTHFREIPKTFFCSWSTLATAAPLTIAAVRYLAAIAGPSWSQEAMRGATAPGAASRADERIRLTRERANALSEHVKPSTC